MIKNLKVKGVVYNSVRRGLAYKCKTNIEGITIWNDGNGGGTYLVNDNDDEYHHLTEHQLEELINDYEFEAGVYKQHN